VVKTGFSTSQDGLRNDSILSNRMLKLLLHPNMTRWNRTLADRIVGSGCLLSEWYMGANELFV